MRWVVILLSLLVLSGCERDEIKKWKVNYRIYTQTNDPMEYRVTYTLQNGSTKSKGPLNDFIWTSEDLEEFEDEKYVRFDVEVISGESEFRLEILRDGAIHESGIKPKSVNSYFIESIL